MLGKGYFNNFREQQIKKYYTPEQQAEYERRVEESKRIASGMTEEEAFIKKQESIAYWNESAELFKMTEPKVWAYAEKIGYLAFFIQREKLKGDSKFFQELGA